LSLLDSTLVDVPSAIAAGAGGIGVLITGLLLGIRHGFDWDHIAAITDITSTSAAADAGSERHEADHIVRPHPHGHAHGGADEIGVHRSGTGNPAATAAMELTALPARRIRFAAEQRHAVVLGTLYALGHAFVVFALGLLALTFGAILPDWVDPIMGRVVGITLVALGAWVFLSLWRYARGGAEFRLRSRWMLVFHGIRYGWRNVQARFHGHEHVEPLEMSSYGRRTALGVGMIHGIGAETGSQALLIAAVGGASGVGLGIPMLVAFSIGLVAANTAIVVVSTTGFVAGQVRRPIYLAIGVLAGTFSIAVGLAFVLGTESWLPDLTQLLGGGL
jgi:high-affinity nickel-transport protein